MLPPHQAQKVESQLGFGHHAEVFATWRLIDLTRYRAVCYLLSLPFLFSMLYHRDQKLLSHVRYG
jgi:hypothetical protein